MVDIVCISYTLRLERASGAEKLNPGMSDCYMQRNKDRSVSAVKTPYDSFHTLCSV